MITVNITNETKHKLPKVEFEAIAKEILGEDYILNVVIVSPGKIKKLNTIYRDKEVPTDILSFPISKDEGEMYICVEETKKEAIKFERSYENFFPFLFIHGCVHLKGYDHGAIMESIEAKVRKQFGI
jgi:probable rRNA maturation factor